MSINLQSLVAPQDYLQGREHIFPSEESFRWFCRQNHAELMRRQAVVMPAGRRLVNVAAFDEAVVEIGAHKAAARSRRGAAAAQGWGDATEAP